MPSIYHMFEKHYRKVIKEDKGGLGIFKGTQGRPPEKSLVFIQPFVFWKCEILKMATHFDPAHVW